MKFNKSEASKAKTSKQATPSTIIEPKKVAVKEVVAEKEPTAEPAEEVKPKTTQPIAAPAPKAAKAPVTPKVVLKVSTETSPKAPVAQVEETKMEESDFEKFDGDMYMDEADEAIFKEFINQNKVTFCVKTIKIRS
jgi:hypothetical protein